MFKRGLSALLVFVKGYPFIGGSMIHVSLTGVIGLIGSLFNKDFCSECPGLFCWLILTLPIAVLGFIFKIGSDARFGNFDPGKVNVEDVPYIASVLLALMEQFPLAGTPARRYIRPRWHGKRYDDQMSRWLEIDPATYPVQTTKTKRTAGDDGTERIFWDENGSLVVNEEILSASPAMFHSIVAYNLAQRWLTEHDTLLPEDIDVGTFVGFAVVYLGLGDISLNGAFANLTNDYILVSTTKFFQWSPVVPVQLAIAELVRQELDRGVMKQKKPYNLRSRWLLVRTEMILAWRGVDIRRRRGETEVAYLQRLIGD